MDRESVIATGSPDVLWVVKPTHLCEGLTVAGDVTMFGVLPHFFLTRSYK